MIFSTFSNLQVAQLSMGLPQHMNIDSTIRQHEERVKREHLDEEVSKFTNMVITAIVTVRHAVV